MNLGGTSGSRLVSDWSDALWRSWGGWDCDVLGTGTARWKLGVYMSQITAVVIDYFCIIIECTLTLYYYCCCYTVAVIQVYVTQVAVIKSPFLRLDVMLQVIIVLRSYSVSRTLLTGQLVQEFIIIKWTLYYYYYRARLAAGIPLILLELR